MTLTPKQAKKRGRKGGLARTPKKQTASAANGKLSALRGPRKGIQDEFTNRADLSRAMKSYWRKKRSINTRSINQAE